jgi:hypothetical protein
MATAELSTEERSRRTWRRVMGIGALAIGAWLIF